MLLAASVSTLFLVSSITGSPLEARNSSITLPLTTRLNFANGTINFLQHDKARVAAFGGYNTHGRRADSIPMTSRTLLYTVTVGVGSPLTSYNLVVDTGSSVTWIGASTPYVRTRTSVETDWPVMENYGSEGAGPRAFFEGTIYRDTVTLGGLIVTNFQLGVASTAAGLDPGEDGILGLGPRVLSLNTMLLAMDETIPTFTDYLYNQEEIGNHIVGIFFQPTSNPDNCYGELTFGEPDNTKFIGNIVYTSITNIPPASHYWGIKQRITYGQEEILGTTVGIVDTGTNFISIASDAYERYKAATGGTLDPRTGLLRITRNQYRALRPLKFHIEGQIFRFTRNAQILPRSFNSKFHPNVDPNNMYLVVIDIGTPSGGGCDFTIGYLFMQRFYTVLDGSLRRVGFAPTQFTDAIIP